LRYSKKEERESESERERERDGALVNARQLVGEIEGQR
jgi:hypothetical protein